MGKALIIIQARYDSKRLPGKILKELRPKLSCLEYLIQRLTEADYNVRLATSDRMEEETKLIEHYNEYKLRYSNLLQLCMGDYKNIASRLYGASIGYEYIIRITGDDIFVDVGILNKLAEKTIDGNYDYGYTKDLIRGCDCDIFKRDSLRKAMELYDTTDFESIEFLMKNNNFRTCTADIPEYYKKDISLTLDTPEDWNLVRYVFSKLYPLYKYFTTHDIVEFFSRNELLTDINRKPKVTIYTVFKDYPIKWLANAIKSVSKQGIDCEYILIDYGSKSLTHFKNYINDREIHFYCLDAMSFIDAIRYAISKAQGKYILRLDADDELKPQAIDEMFQYIKKNDHYSMVIPNYDTMNEAGEIQKKNIAGEILDLPTCALIEKKKYKYVKFLDGQKFRDGTSLMKRFRELDFLVGYLEKPLFNYRIHDKSITHGKYSKEEIESLDEVINASNE